MSTDRPTAAATGIDAEELRGPAAARGHDWAELGKYAVREADGRPVLPWVDPEDFNPGYLVRSLHLLPRQGDHDPWRHEQDYPLDRERLPAADLDDGTLAFD